MNVTMTGMGGYPDGMTRDDLRHLEGLHHSECENHEYYYCWTCRELTHESSLNFCAECQTFIPRILDCICDQLEWEEHEPSKEVV